MTIANSIKTNLPKIESAKRFMWLVGERSQTVDKSVAGTLMSTLGHHEVWWFTYYVWTCHWDDKHCSKT